MTYKKLPIEDFGTALIKSGDLDPIYIALYRLEMPFDKLARWLIAYWCLYHPGVASYMSDQSDSIFWREMRVAALNIAESPMTGRWPRAAERRHWRGTAAMKSLDSLREFGSPTEILGMLRSPEKNSESYPISYEVIHKRAITFVGFGPWIAFKIADMLERLNLAKISFSQASCFMFRDPKKAALKLYYDRAGINPAARLKRNQAAIDEVVNYLLGHFSGNKAPPLYDRPIGFQEVETVLCKWKSHMNGHYPLYNDLAKISVSCQVWSKVSSTANEFYQALPIVPGNFQG